MSHVHFEPPHVAVDARTCTRSLCVNTLCAGTRDTPRASATLSPLRLG